MKSISERIALWYVLTTMVTLACLFLAGHYLLEQLLIHQLDTLNGNQFKHLKSAMGANYDTLKPAEIDERIREVTESASAMFYIDIHGPMTNRFFKSSNLRGQSIPDIPGMDEYTADVEGIGTLRIREFKMKPFEVVVATPMNSVSEVMRGYRQVFLLLMASTLVISIAFGFWLSRLVLKPIRLIQETANRIRSDNLNERIPVAEVKDEISQLAHLLNQMFDRLEVSFTEIRRFAADASHELKTPLSLVRLHGERLLTSGILDSSQRESIQDQLEELAHINLIIEELLFLSRADARAIEVTKVLQNPREFLQSFSHDANALAEHHGVDFSWRHFGENLFAFESKRIRQVLLNLLVNALNVTPANKKITLDSNLTGGNWRLVLQDEGPGLSQEQRSKMFDRFVRFPNVSTQERGSGLGLAICRSIINLHGGKIQAEAVEGSTGLRMVIEIPAC